MKVILDAGALIALERDDPGMWRRLKGTLQTGDTLVTHGGVVGQVWRGRGGRQARLARALTYVQIRAIDSALGRSSGELLATAHLKDVIDAALVLLAGDGDQLITSDPDDIEPLAAAVGRDIEIVVV